jgi:hypothetical protein
MTNRLTISTILALLLALAPAASADVVFSDFASTSPSYDTGSGHSLGPGGAGGANLAFASSFTPTAAYNFTSLEIALFDVFSTNIDTFRVSLTSDSGSGVPGTTTLASFDIAPGTLTAASSILTFSASGPTITLTSGTPYWVTVTDLNSHGSDSAGWNNNNIGYMGVVANSLNGGTTWHGLTAGVVASGAFEIDGTLTQTSLAPEPATSFTAIVGAVGFIAYGWCRRRKATAA